MHFLAEVKPTSYIHTMWTNHRRRSAQLNFVLFTVDDRGTFTSDELPDDKIEWFRARPHIFNLIVMGISPTPAHEIEGDFVETPVEAEAKKIPRPRRRPTLKE